MRLQENKMMKYIPIFITFFISFLFNNLGFAADKVKEYSIGLAPNRYYTTWKNHYNMENPILVNVMSNVWSPFYGVEPTKYEYYYNFNWDENAPKSTNWNYTYIDAVTQQIFSATVVLQADDKTNWYNYDDITFIDNDITIYFGLEFAKGTGLNLDTCEYRMREFVKTIKSDAALFEKLEAVSYATELGPFTDNFFIGIGYLKSLGFKEASHYGIDATRPICFVYTKPFLEEYDVDFCYSYADAPITELKCIHNYVSISETSEFNNILLTPNPVKSATTLTFDIENSGNLNIILNDLNGGDVMQLYNGFTTAGTFTHTFSVANLPNGIYFVRIQISSFIKYEKLIIE